MRAMLALTFAGAVSLFTSVGAMAQQTPKETPATPPGNKIDSVKTPTDRKSLTEFWTQERLDEAPPKKMPRVDPNTFKK